jgi:hypothetical protein
MHDLKYDREIQFFVVLCSPTFLLNLARSNLTQTRYEDAGEFHQRAFFCQEIETKYGQVETLRDRSRLFSKLYLNLYEHLQVSYEQFVHLTNEAFAI